MAKINDIQNIIKAAAARVMICIGVMNPHSMKNTSFLSASGGGCQSVIAQIGRKIKRVKGNIRNFHQKLRAVFVTDGKITKNRAMRDDFYGKTSLSGENGVK